MNHNLIDVRPYNRDTYLDIFETLHNVNDIPPYPMWPQDNQYYSRHMDTFMADMRQLLNNDRELFNEIFTRVQIRRRGPSELRTRMTALTSAQNQNIIGGRRRSRKGLRISKSKSRKNRHFNKISG
jgi:hypothetical protein